MKELLEQGYGILLVIGVAGIGVLVRILLMGYYGMLGSACSSFGETKNKTISYIREDLSFRAKNNIGMKSVTVYTECRLAECKVCGIRLGTLEGISEQSLLLVVLSGVLLAFAGVLWNCDGRQILFLLFTGGVSFLGLLLVDVMTGLREKHKRIRLAIRDYIENGVHVERNGERPLLQEKPEQRKREKKEKVQKSVKVKTSASSGTIKGVGRKKNGKAQEEKRRLTEELLRERRQMEARSFAQMRKAEAEGPEKESRVQTPELTRELHVEPESQAPLQVKLTEQENELRVTVPVKPIEKEHGLREETVNAAVRAVEEAAATKVSYEVMLSEVLAEYLA